MIIIYTYLNIFYLFNFARITTYNIINRNSERFTRINRATNHLAAT